MTMYATLSHRKVRGWAHLRKVEQHNNREIDTPAREAGRPLPVELLEGPGDMVERTEALLTSKGVPRKLRKNSVLAFEDVFGASAEYWERRYPQGWRNVSVEELRQDPLILTYLAYVRAKYGHKLVSVRLHIDEKSPHLHVVSIPLVTQLHKQRGRQRADGVVPAAVMKTTLYASAVRGGSGRRLETEHDELAAAVAHIEVDGLRLERGQRGSDLTEEERRDRRLREDKASRAGEERARIDAEGKAFAEAAKADRKRAADIVSDAEQAASKQLSDAAEAAAATLEGARQTIADEQVEADRLMHAAKAAEERAAQTEAVLRERLADAEQAQRDLKRELREAEARTEAAATDRAQAAKTAADAESDRGMAAEQRRAATADREASDRDRATAAAANRNAELTERQLALISRASADDALELALAENPRGVTMNEAAMTGHERDAYRATWSALVRNIARTVAKVLAQARDVVAAAIDEAKRHREAALNERRRQSALVAEQRRQFNIEKILLGKDRAKAKAFIAAWEGIPDAERSPRVEAAIQKAGILAQAAKLIPGDATQAKGRTEVNTPDSSVGRGPGQGR